jgi:hypothetical protein
MSSALGPDAAACETRRESGDWFQWRYPNSGINHLGSIVLGPAKLRLPHLSPTASNCRADAVQRCTRPNWSPSSTSLQCGVVDFRCVCWAWAGRNQESPNPTSTPDPCNNAWQISRREMPLLHCRPARRACLWQSHDSWGLCRVHIRPLNSVSCSEKCGLIRYRNVRGKHGNFYMYAHVA